jgi:hypothetical protein
MTIAEIKAAVDNGKTVQWINSAYKVIKDQKRQYLIHYLPKDTYIGLTDIKGKYLNGFETDFTII